MQTSHEAELVSTSNQMKELRSLLRKKEADLKEALGNTSHVEQFVQTLQAEISMKDNIIKKLHQKINDTAQESLSHIPDNSSISNPSDLLRDRNQESVAKLNKNLSELQSRHRDLSSEYEKIAAENHELKRQFNDMKQRLHEMNILLKSKDADILQDKRDSDRQVRDYEEKMKALERNLNITIESNDKLKADVHNSVSQIQHLRPQLEHTKRERDELVDTKSNHERLISQLKYQIKNLEDENSQLGSKVANLMRSSTTPSKLNKDIEDIKEKMSMLSSKVQNKRSFSPKEDMFYSATDLIERENRIREVNSSLSRKAANAS